MQPIDNETKVSIVTESRLWVRSRWPELESAYGCLYETLGAVIVARKRGIKLLPQAGTVNWLAVAPELDDGVSANSASYTWDPEGPLSKLSVAQGWMPEMHCWAADPDRMEIVDTTTGAQMERFAPLFDWTAPPLPDFLWGKPEKGWIYEPVKDAVQVACGFMCDVLGEVA